MKLNFGVTFVKESSYYAKLNNLGELGRLVSLVQIVEYCNDLSFFRKEIEGFLNAAPEDDELKRVWQDLKGLIRCIAEGTLLLREHDIMRNYTCQRTDTSIYQNPDADVIDSGTEVWARVENVGGRIMFDGVRPVWDEITRRLFSRIEFMSWREGIAIKICAAAGCGVFFLQGNRRRYHSERCRSRQAQRDSRARRAEAAKVS